MGSPRVTTSPIRVTLTTMLPAFFFCHVVFLGFGASDVHWSS